MIVSKDDALAYCPFYRWAKQYGKSYYVISCENPLSTDESERTSVHHNFRCSDEWDNHFVKYCSSKNGCKNCRTYQSNMKKYC